MQTTIKNYISGKWVESHAQRTLQDINPANRNHCLSQFPDSTAQDVDQAVRSARKALTSWRRTPAPQRGKTVQRMGELIQENAEELAQLVVEENGKVLREAEGDVEEAIEMASFIAQQARLLGGKTYPSESRDKLCMTLRQPVGVCVLITPWNFPFALPSWKLFPALVCGNTVVFKPSEETPLSGQRLVEIAIQAGVPEGVVNLVQGKGETVGRALVKHSGVDLVSFTGSTQVGREIAETCGQQLKRCSLELGGKNAQIVLEDANLEHATQGAIAGAFGTSGQRCTATSRIIVHKKILSEFKDRLITAITQLKVGNGMQPGIDLGPIINQKQLENVHAYVAIGQKEGGRLVLGGKYFVEGDCQNGFFYTPTLFDQVNPSMRIAQEEIFGPVTSILQTSSLDEAVSILNNTSYGLSASVYTEDIRQGLMALESIEAGMVTINGPTVGCELHMPFGGIKNTGNGHREAGKHGFNIFTEWKSAYIHYRQNVVQ